MVFFILIILAWFISDTVLVQYRFKDCFLAREKMEIEL